MPVKPPIYVWEHEFLPVGKVFNVEENSVEFSQLYYDLLEKYIERHNRKLSYMFDTSRRSGKDGILFKQYVGVITVKDLTIYVLPKADKDAKVETEDKDLWRNCLTFMLSQVYKLNVQTTAPANLQRKPNMLLNIFLKNFLDEVAVLLNRGLIKTYRKTDGNRTALKGKLLFNKQIAYNCVHQERFHVRYTTYDYNHILNRIIRQALLATHDITNSSDIKGRATSTLFNFPELDEIPVTPELFSHLIFDRKSEDYRNVIKLAEMILLNYSPDLQRGSNHVWTLMFDMNKLWEEYVFIMLRNQLWGRYEVNAQESRDFWGQDDVASKHIRPDIVIRERNAGKVIAILDTKWKCPDQTPSDGDLHQMFAYAKMFKTEKVALIYPSVKDGEMRKGHFWDNTTSCDMVFLSLKDKVIIKEEVKRLFEGWLILSPQVSINK